MGLVGCIKTKDTVWDDIVFMITSAHTVRFLYFGTGFNIFVEIVVNAPEKAGKYLTGSYCRNALCLKIRILYDAVIIITICYLKYHCFLYNAAIKISSIFIYINWHRAKYIILA